MKKVLFILTLVILASCSPTKRLARLLERHPQPEKRDTLYIPGETIYRDTTVYKYLPGEVSVESTYIDVPISIPDTFIEASTSAADAIAYLQDNVLGLQLIQFDTVIQWKIDSALVYHTDTIKVNVEKIVTVEKMVNKPFYKNGFFILAGLISIALLFYFLLKR